MKLQNKDNTYLIISRNNYMHRYNNGIIYGKKGKTIFRKAMTKIWRRWEKEWIDTGMKNGHVFLLSEAEWSEHTYLLFFLLL